MANFLLSYFGGNSPSSPEEGQQHMARYKAWLAGLGDTAVSPMNPLKHIHTLQPDGTTAQGSATGMSGYTIIAAESREEAMAIARACPFLEVGGTLEVGEMIVMGD